MTTEKAAIPFRPDLEGLRGIAVLLVVAYHCGIQSVPSGFLGVDLFFVLSGFLIGSLLIREARQTRSISLAGFFARRARRLLPAASVVTVAVVLLMPELVSPVEVRTRLASAIAFAFYGSNMLFAQRGSDYFAADLASDPLLHTWSLSVEEQFYLIVAPLALALLALLRGRSVSRSRVVTIVVAVAAAISLLVYLRLLRTSPVLSFYTLPARAWELALGVLLASMTQHGFALSARSARIGLVIATIALGIGVAMASHTFATTAGTRILVVLAGWLFIAAGDRASWNWLTARPLRFIGRVSYSWYLVHWPALVALRRHGESRMTTRVAVAAVTLLLAFALYRWVELPFRRSELLARRPRRVFAGALAAAALVILATGATRLRNDAFLQRSDIAAIMEAKQSRPLVRENGCDGRVTDDVVAVCSWGYRGDPVVVLFGDSHASQWFPALQYTLRQHHWRLVSLTLAGCPSVSVSQGWKPDHATCSSWRDLSLERIRALRPAAVLLTNSSQSKVDLGHGAVRIDLSDEASRLWETGLKVTLDAIAPSRARVAVLLDSPIPGFDVPGCLTDHLVDPHACDYRLSEARAPRVVEAETRAASKAGAAVINLTDIVCAGSTCAAMKGARPVFMDANHLAASFVKGESQRIAEGILNGIGTARRTGTEGRAR